MFSDLMFRLRALFRRKAVEAELDDELRAHFAHEVEKHVKAGVPRDEATRLARLALGGFEQVKEQCREARGTHLLETTLQDLRYALRILSRTPAITTVAVLSLALGIGANTAIFSLIDTLLLQLLPVHRPEELVRVEFSWERGPETNANFTNPLWEQIRDRQDVFSGVFASSPQRFDLAHGGQARYANGLYVSGDYFSTLGVRSAAGRLIGPDDDRRGCPGVAVINYGFWSDRYGRSQNAIGSSLLLDNHPFQIIGVTSRGFFGVDVGENFDVAIPVCAESILRGKDSFLDHRSAWWLSVIGRLNPGVTQEQAAARLRVLGPGIFEAAVPDWGPEGQERFRHRNLVLHPGAQGFSYLRREYERPLEILMIIVGLVLLIACSNLASLMLARASAREREIAMRKALGASRNRLIRQLLTECLLLSCTGAVLGTFFAYWGDVLLVRYLSTQQQPVFLDLSPNARVLGFTAAVAVLTGLLFGVFPAFRSTRISLIAAMKGRRAADGERRLPFRAGKWIVASQVALSLVLLVAAGLFLRSLVKLATVNLGFDRNNVLLVTANLKTANFPPEHRLVTYDQIEERLRALPGFTSVGRSIRTPITNWEWDQEVQADSPNPPKGEAAAAYFNFVSPGYFETLRIPVLEGRNFNFQDGKNSAKVAIVNQTLARKFYPGLDPIGRSFRLINSTANSGPPFEIVGVVSDSKYGSIREETFAQVFSPPHKSPKTTTPRFSSFAQHWRRREWHRRCKMPSLA